MAFRALSVSEPQRVTLESDPDKENPTVFLVAPLSSKEMARIMDASSTMMPQPTDDNPNALKINFHGNQGSLEIVRKAVKGWENLPGVDEPNDKRKCGEVLIDNLHLDVIRELALKIRNLSSVTPEDAGNSEG